MFVIDRIEEGIALIYDDNGLYEKVDASLIDGAKEGAVVTNSNGVWHINNAKTEEVTKSMQKRLNNLFNRK